MLRNKLVQFGQSFAKTQLRTYVASATKGKHKELSLEEQLEVDAARILRVVQQRAEERDLLMKEPVGDGSSAEHIQRAKLIKELEPLHEAWTSWKNTKHSLRDTADLLQDPDPDIRSMAMEERDSLTSTLQNHVENTFPSLLLPPSSTRRFSALIEMKSGVGGDESSLFLTEVMRMYNQLASSENLRTETVSVNEQDGSKGGGGGIKDAILEIKGEGAYDLFKWESGVHRVQRVPATETQGRVHTSTIAVVVLPTADETSRGGEEDFHVDEKDVKTDVMRARGAGGQHVNKTESAVRLTHIPTGITVSMQDSRSQHQNRAKAWQILRARLLDRKITDEIQKRRDSRRNLVKSADRSEKIRTYNFPQNRVTDHRIGMTTSNLEAVLEGEGLRAFIEELQKDNEAAMIEDLLNTD